MENFVKLSPKRMNLTSNPVQITIDDVVIIAKLQTISVFSLWNPILLILPSNIFWTIMISISFRSSIQMDMSTHGKR